MVEGELPGSFYLTDNRMVMHCMGEWKIPHIRTLKRQLKSLDLSSIIAIDGSEISGMDSAGASLLNDFYQQIRRRNSLVKYQNFKPSHQSLIDLVDRENEKFQGPIQLPEPPNPLHSIGVWAVDKVAQLKSFLTFTGELTVTFFEILLEPRKMSWRSIWVAIEVNGYQALAIVALMAFLIGIVLAYQLAEQLRGYGADIYIVDVTGIALLREFGPLITAIIIAGRTSTSFAALIGTMKVNEEIDALQTMGISPVARLVIPRILGLLIALPLLSVWADYFGVFGSMVMSAKLLHIGFVGYMDRFRYAVGLKQYMLGLIKTPVFALIISAVGCYQGFQVSMSAESVGVQTTKAAVQAIFLIIITDAIFSIIFSEMGY